MGAELEMKVTLEVIAGPQAGREFCFDGRDSFLVGRSKDAHFQVAHDDSFFSRRHFVIELLPPRSRLLDLKSRNGVYVNGEKVPCAELRDGDQIKAGTTVFRVQIQQPVPDDVETDFLPSYSAPDLATVTSAGDCQAIRRLSDCPTDRSGGCGGGLPGGAHRGPASGRDQTDPSRGATQGSRTIPARN